MEKLTDVENRLIVLDETLEMMEINKDRYCSKISPEKLSDSMAHTKTGA